MRAGEIVRSGLGTSHNASRGVKGCTRGGWL